MNIVTPWPCNNALELEAKEFDVMASWPQPELLLNEIRSNEDRLAMMRALAAAQVGVPLRAQHRANLKLALASMSTELKAKMHAIHTSEDNVARLRQLAISQRNVPLPAEQIAKRTATILARSTAHVEAHGDFRITWSVGKQLYRVYRNGESSCELKTFSVKRRGKPAALALAQQWVQVQVTKEQQPLPPPIHPTTTPWPHASEDHPASAQPTSDAPAAS